ncbi:MAG: RluA family pseudouridine synthase, partial [Clostridia bacterium]
MRIDEIAGEDDCGARLDTFLSGRCKMSRAAVQAIIENGGVTCENSVLKKNYRLRGTEKITIDVPEAVSYDVVAQDIPLDIVYEDEDLVVVNKARGMVVHPAPGNLDGTLVNALLAHCGTSLSGIGGVQRPGIVHRLDKDTSGLMLVAKNDAAHQSLALQIAEHSAFRVYHALIYGHLKESSGTVDAPIGRHKLDRKRMAVCEYHSRNAITHYRTIEEFAGFAHVECRLETGRTHQIRVHMAYLGHPVVGDPAYAKGRDALGLNGQCLHSKSI